MTLNTKRLRRLFKEGFWIVLGQVIMVTGALVGVRLLTELLSPSSYGELALGMTIATLVNQTILGPLCGGITRFYAPAIECGDISRYLNALRKLVLYAVGLIVFMAVVSIVVLAIAGEAKWAIITGIALLYAAFSGCNAVVGGIQSAARQRAIMAFYQGGDICLRLLISVGLMLWLGVTSTIAIVGYAIAAAIVSIFQLFYVKNISIGSFVNANEKKNWDQEIWRFSWPVGIFGFFTWMQLSSDRWALQAFSTTSDVGNYAVLYQLGIYPVTMIIGVVMQFVLPILYQHIGDARNETRNNSANKLIWYITWVSLGLSAFIFLIALVFHELIFLVFVAQDYSIHSYLLPWMVLAGGFFASGQALASSLLAQMKTRQLMTATIATAVFGIILNFVGAYWFGIIGLVYAGIVFSMLYFLCIVMLVKGQYK